MRREGFRSDGVGGSRPSDFKKSIETQFGAYDPCRLDKPIRPRPAWSDWGPNRDVLEMAEGLLPSLTSTFRIQLEASPAERSS